ncbi:hypothetical protein [Streptomyces sp. RKAG290]|uniref:hypothetical protein n=1 Tax=Streptomyces sp. RKAG290 TaxID=2888348 RepID=UPI0027E32C60|nr:hypothetical protein [Streptomyces sp. RKAG290]
MQQLSQVGTALRKEMAGAYDIVSLDPRGVGGSTKASCGLAEADRHLVSLKAWPAPDGQIDEDIARRDAAQCVGMRLLEACARSETYPDHSRWPVKYSYDPEPS